MLNRGGVYGIFLIILLITSCENGSGGNSSNIVNNKNNQSSSSEQSNVSSQSNSSEKSDWNKRGYIVFEQAHSNGFHIPQGIYRYDIAADTTTRITSGIYPRQNAGSSKTVFLRQCDTRAAREFYQVAIINAQSSVQPISPCSTELANPTTGVAFLEDYTEFGFANLSPDESLISVTRMHPLLNESQTARAGTAINTMIYDVFGNLITEIENAYDADWLPDGRLLYAFGNNFYLTDTSLTNAMPITAEGTLQTNVNNPAVHPSGDFFVFEYNGQIWQMNIDGSGLRKLLEDNKILRYPAWSPNGDKFVFTVWDTNFTSTLQSLFFYDPIDNQSYRLDIGQHLEVLGEPWGPLSWHN